MTHELASDSVNDHGRRQEQQRAYDRHESRSTERVPEATTQIRGGIAADATSVVLPSDDDGAATLSEESLTVISETPAGREVLRGYVARGGELPMPPPRRSKHGLDVNKFTVHLLAQPTKRDRRVGTRALGPMPIDVRLMDRLDEYARRHDVSRRSVVECLLTELLSHDTVPATPAVAGE